MANVTDAARPVPTAEVKPAGPVYVHLEAGDPAPYFTQRATNAPRFVFDTAGGRYIVLCFFASAGDPVSRKALESVAQHRALFDDDRASFFGVTVDPRDAEHLHEQIPGIRFFLDLDGAVSRLYGAAPSNSASDGRTEMRRFWALLDPTLRIIGVYPFDADGGGAPLFAALEALPPPRAFAGIELQAPVLFLPNVFEPEFCRMLIKLYQQHGGTESGFMREVDGKTVLVTDAKHKKRADYTIDDNDLIQACRDRIRRHLIPEIKKVFNFEVTRMERYIVACYSSDTGGHFAAHRDNITKGTAHRRFAVSINLNGDFEGGELNFPEYGPRSFKPPPGGAVVFSCSLLHAASRVTAGTRYAFLPFLYDEQAAAIREANNKFLGEGVGAYTPSGPDNAAAHPPAT